MSGVEDQLEYFRYLVRQNNEKLNFFDLFQNSLDTADEVGWQWWLDVDNMKSSVFEQLDGQQLQLQALDEHFSNLNFEMFMMEQEWQAADEAAFQADAARAEEQKTDYITE